jgi:CCR4-NOT transcription complex subunit 7/8
MGEVEFVDVWADNLEESFVRLRAIVDDYPFVGMDTEFPGVVAHPVGNFSKSEYNYQMLRCNVDMLKLIQLGMSFCDENGNSPKGAGVWQFHFKFDLADEMYAQESIDLLKRAGIDFKKHSDYGIDPMDFGELLISSGVVLNPEVKWIAFHSGYDLGYLCKLLTNKALPKRQVDFFETVTAFFPVIYDVKYMMKSCRNLKGGLQELADDLEVMRVGPQH